MTYKTIESDVLVIGGGAAGMGAAIKAKSPDNTVILVEKAKAGRSGCSPFTAGIWTIRFPEDDTETWMKEIIQWGEYLNDQEWVKTFLEKIHPSSMELDRWGEQYGLRVFEKDEKGAFIRRRSRGHLNTLHGLINSIPMVDTMRRRAEEKGVHFVERIMVTDLVRVGEKVVGAVGFNYRTGDVYLFRARAVVAAAGGRFRGYYFATKSLSGDLIAAAYKAGAVMKNFENTMSNTMARDFAIHGLNLTVGTGGRFLNNRGEEFMWQYDPVLGNRARLQSLAIAFCQEVKEGRGPIYLDMSRCTPEDQKLMRKILPHTFKTWDRSGVDFFKDRIPWVPAFHGAGGVHINTACESSLQGLYAAGDNAGQPHHGTYSIGGLAISFAYLSGTIAGESAAQYAASVKGLEGGEKEEKAQVEAAIKKYLAPLDKDKRIKPDEVIRDIHRIIISMPVGYIRNEESLKKGLEEIERIRDESLPNMNALDSHELRKAQEARSLATIAELILRAALFRKESRGFHFREDYPYTDNRNWLKWVMVQEVDGKPGIWAQDIPTPYLRPSEEVSVPPGVKKLKGGA